MISATYTSGSSTLSSPITVNGSLVLNAASGATLNVTGAIANGTDTNSSVTHDLSVNGPGTVVLSDAETYTGTTIVNSGTLTLPGVTAADAGVGRGLTQQAVLRSTTDHQDPLERFSRHALERSLRIGVAPTE